MVEISLDVAAWILGAGQRSLIKGQAGFNSAVTHTPLHQYQVLGFTGFTSSEEVSTEQCPTILISFGE